MKDIRKVLSSLLVLLLFLFNPFLTLVSADWPVFQINSQNTGSDPTETTLLPPLTLAWSLPQITNAHIVESGNTIYAKSDTGVLYSINASTGAINWQVQTAGGGEIAFANNIVYSGNGTSLDAFNASNGQLLWNFPVYPAGITISGNVVYFSSGNHAYAVDGMTGSGIWGIGLLYSDSAAPAVANNMVYLGTYQGNMVALDAATGATVWQSGNGYGNYVGAPDVQNNMVYVGNRSGGWLDAYNGITGGLVWQFHTRADTNISNTVAYANNKLYTQDEQGTVYAFDQSNGEIVWKHVTSSPDNQVPVIIANGVVYQGSSGNNLNAFDAQTGSLLWQYATGSITRIINANNTLFVSSTGGLLAFRNPPSTVTLAPSADTFLNMYEQNQNEGSSPILDIEQSIKGRGLIRFDESAIQQAVGNSQNYTATLQFTITDNGNNWGTGRNIEVDRLSHDWIEGNGYVRNNPSPNKGIGSGATWNCGIDTDISNNNKNCIVSDIWDMDNQGDWPFATPTATALITNHESGIVSFDVTSDIQSFLNGAPNYGWLLRKSDETVTGKIIFGSKESATLPQLIITRN